MEERAVPATVFEITPALHWEAPQMKGHIPIYLKPKYWDRLGGTVIQIEGYKPVDLYDRFAYEAKEWSKNPTKIPEGFSGTSGRSISLRLLGNDELEAHDIIYLMQKFTNVKVIYDFAIDGGIVMTCMEICIKA